LEARIPVKVYIPVMDIVVDVEKIELQLGGKQQIHAEVYPSDATHNSLTYHTDSSGIITLSDDGLVTATTTASSDGNDRVANVYIEDEFGNIKKTIVVTIKESRSSSSSSSSGYIKTGSVQLDGWTGQPYVLNSAAINCTGFKIRYMLTPAASGKKDVSANLVGSNFNIYVCTSDNKWYRVGTLYVGSRNQWISASVTFSTPMNVAKIAFICSKKTPVAGGSYEDNISGLELLYKK